MTQKKCIFRNSAVCPRNLAPFHRVRCSIKWVDTFWTYNIVKYVLKCMSQGRRKLNTSFSWHGKYDI